MPDQVPTGVPGKKSNFLAWIIVVIIPFCALAWWVAPNFLPVWRWKNMDFIKLSQQLGLPKDQLEAVYTVQMRYAPRGLGDPAPWQIMRQEPLFREEEENVWVRCSFISDRTGVSVSDLQLGSGTRFDKFWHAKVWRFPPGTFGQNAKRPVLVYDARTLESFDKNQAAMCANEFGMDIAPRGKDWTYDDEEVEDGYVPPAPPDVPAEGQAAE